MVYTRLRCKNFFLHIFCIGFQLFFNIIIRFNITIIYRISITKQWIITICFILNTSTYIINWKREDIITKTINSVNSIYLISRTIIVGINPNRIIIFIIYNFYFKIFTYFIYWKVIRISYTSTVSVRFWTSFSIYFPNSFRYISIFTNIYFILIIKVIINYW